MAREAASGEILGCAPGTDVILEDSEDTTMASEITLGFGRAFPLISPGSPGGVQVLCLGTIIVKTYMECHTSVCCIVLNRDGI